MTSTPDPDAVGSPVCPDTLVDPAAAAASAALSAGVDGQSIYISGCIQMTLAIWAILYPSEIIVQSPQPA